MTSSWRPGVQHPNLLGDEFKIPEKGYLVAVTDGASASHSQTIPEEYKSVQLNALGCDVFYRVNSATAPLVNGSNLHGIVISETNGVRIALPRLNGSGTGSISIRFCAAAANATGNVAITCFKELS